MLNMFKSHSQKITFAEMLNMLNALRTYRPFGTPQLSEGDPTLNITVEKCFFGSKNVPFCRNVEYVEDAQKPFSKMCFFFLGRC